MIDEGILCFWSTIGVDTIRVILGDGPTDMTFIRTDGLCDQGSRFLEFHRYMRYMDYGANISEMRLVSVRYKMFNFK